MVEPLGVLVSQLLNHLRFHWSTLKVDLHIFIDFLIIFNALIVRWVSKEISYYFQFLFGRYIFFLIFVLKRIFIQIFISSRQELGLILDI